MQNLVTILGPTATGKTKLATALAYHHNGEIISADSRQVFKHMDIGTGKDLDEYIINDLEIPYHLIDILEPGSEYSLFDFQKDFCKAFQSINENNKLAIMCGGSTMYLDSILNRYELIDVPDSFQLPEAIESKRNDELIDLLKSKTELHNSSDTQNRDRLLKAIRISLYKEDNPNSKIELPELEHTVFGIDLPMDEIKQKITVRLKERLKNGMIEEAQNLLDLGVSHDMLKYYGLEYKYLSLFLRKEINYNDLFQKLNSAIHSFAKKQKTRYRSIEKNGVPIIWIDGKLALDDKLEIIREHCRFL